MNSYCSHSSIGACVLSAAILCCADAVAQTATTRAGTFDTSVLIGYTEDEGISGSQNSSADIASSTGWGVGFSYNFNDHWALGFEYNRRDADYDIRVTPGAGNTGDAFSRSGTLDVSTSALVGTYHFSLSNLAPFLNANVGGTWVDTNIPTGPPSTACWYDPWWGYYCGTSAPTKSETYLSYGAGLGLRWDSAGPFFMRALANTQWLDVGGAVGTPNFTQYWVDFGVSF